MVIPPLSAFGRRRDLVKLEDADVEEHGGHAFRVMDAYVRSFEAGGKTEADNQKGRRALALLRLLGLFDRPVNADCLDALLHAPAISGLTEPLVGLTEAQRNVAYSSRKLGAFASDLGAVECFFETPWSCDRVQEQIQHAGAKSSMNNHSSVNSQNASFVMLDRSNSLLFICMGLLLIYVSVTAQSPAIGFADTFDAYPAGWSNSGNSNVRGDPSISLSPPQSVRMSGYRGWEALIHRPLNTSTPFTAEAFVYLAAQSSQSFRARISVSALPDWHGAYRYLLWFDNDGVIRGADSLVLGAYVPQRWYKVAVTYERVNPSTIRLSYRLNDVPVGTKIVAAASDEAFTYLTLESGDGTVWFDDVRILKGVGSRTLTFEIASNRTAGLFAAAVFCGGICGRGFNVAVIDRANGDVVDVRHWDPWYYGDSAFQEMLLYLTNVPGGYVLAVSAADETGLYRKTAPGLAVVDFFKRMGSTLIASVGFRDSYAFAGVIGQTTPLAEKIGRNWEPISVQVTVDLVAAKTYASAIPQLIWQNHVTGEFGASSSNGMEFTSSYPFVPAQSTGVNMRIAGAGDFDGDRLSDIVWQNIVSGDIEMWLMEGARLKCRGPEQSILVSADWRIVAVTDVDSDSKSDLVLRNRSSRDVQVWFMDGLRLRHKQSLQPSAGPALDWTLAGFGDFDSNGRNDMVWHNQTTGGVQIWFMDGTRQLRTFVLPTASAPANSRIATVGDLSGDGRPDLIWQNQTTGSVVEWVMFGTTLVRSISLQSVPLAAAKQIVAFAEFDNIPGSSTSVPLCVADFSGPNTSRDFDGDKKADLTVWRPSSGRWHIRYSSVGYSSASADAFQWGLSGDVPMSGDFDGDGKDDLTVFRPANGTWYIHSLIGYGIGTAAVFQWGLPGDVPICGDFDGDGRTDLTVWRPSNGTWYIRYSSLGYVLGSLGQFQWGLRDDIPIAADFDGDAKTDLAVWRPSNATWYVRYSSLGYGLGSFGQYQWGLPGDVPVVADFDGDRKAELAVWRPTNGTWYIRYSSLGYGLSTASAYQWGLSGDVPTSADVDGDGKTELTVWRPSNGTWYVRFSAQSYNIVTAGAIQWGLAGDALVK